MRFHLQLDASAGERVVEAIYHCQDDPDRIGFPHTHDFFEIVYILDGQGHHLINGATSLVQGGDLLFIRPDDCHDYTIERGQRLLFINMSFRANVWLDYCKAAG